MRSGAIWNDLSRDKDLKNKVSVKLNARENRVVRNKKENVDRNYRNRERFSV